MSIYTKTGDDGTTGLYRGKRVSKANRIIEVNGSFDELSSYLGLILSYSLDKDDSLHLRNIQKNLYEIMSIFSGAGNENLETLLKRDVFRFEKEIDKITSSLPPLSKFILPGGNRISSLLHVARTICRKTERAMISYIETVTNQNIFSSMIMYVNRLSDFLFILARKYNELPLAK